MYSEFALFFKNEKAGKKYLNHIQKPQEHLHVSFLTVTAAVRIGKRTEQGS
jgi:hypothetical protein